jgi:hypothetical protein
VQSIATDPACFIGPSSSKEVGSVTASPLLGIVGLGQTGGGERGKLRPVGDPELGVDV